MDSNWTDLVEGLGEEPALSLAALEPPGQHPDQPLDVIDWDALEIIVPQEDEGRDEIVDDIRMYEVLGLRAEDEAFKNASEAGTRAESGPADDVAVENISDDGDDYLGASIPVDDDIPEETVVLHDPNKPCMDVGTVYPTMVEFRLAIRQFAINEEFELKIVKSDPTRFIGDCRAQDCRWHIVGRRQPDGKSVMVTVLFAKHNCTSSELGHGETSYKCPLNGTKKRKRKPRKNTTKYGENAKVPTSRKRAKKGENVQQMEEGAAAVQQMDESAAAMQEMDESAAAVQEMDEGAAAVQQMDEGAAAVQEWEDGAPVPLLMQSPTKPTMESIIQNSPIRVTRSRLAMLMGDGTASQSNVQTSPTCTTKPMPRKLTPKKLKMK